jgi:hypothetical protein
MHPGAKNWRGAQIERIPTVKKKKVLRREAGLIRGRTLGPGLRLNPSAGQHCLDCCAAQLASEMGQRLKGSQRAYRVRRTPMAGRNAATLRFQPWRGARGIRLSAKRSGAAMYPGRE